MIDIVNFFFSQILLLVINFWKKLDIFNPNKYNLHILLNLLKNYNYPIYYKIKLHSKQSSSKKSFIKNFFIFSINILFIFIYSIIFQNFLLLSFIIFILFIPIFEILS